MKCIGDIRSLMWMDHEACLNRPIKQDRFFFSLHFIVFRGRALCKTKFTVSTPSRDGHYSTLEEEAVRFS